MEAITVDLFCPVGQKDCRHIAVTPTCIAYDRHASLFCHEDFHLTLELYDCEPVSNIAGIIEACQRQGNSWQRFDPSSKFQGWIQEKFFANGELGKDYHIKDHRICPGCGFQTEHDLVIRSKAGLHLQTVVLPRYEYPRSPYPHTINEVKKNPQKEVVSCQVTEARSSKSLSDASPSSDNDTNWEFLGDKDMDDDWQMV
ncbi:MAG: hypothetical protein M1812_004536 [Candelaria pacifica]|nr:MAG: hypothetical protein M1812_004536 [Candelaria pacifica]